MVNCDIKKLSIRFNFSKKLILYIKGDNCENRNDRI